MADRNGPDLEQQPGAILARRVQEARKRRGWSQQALADRLEELGYPLPRSTLAKIEQGGTRADARLGDVLALAAALGVAPVHLIVPLEDEGSVALTPRVAVLAPVARAWIRGEIALPMQPDVNLAELPRSELRQLVERELTRGMDQIASNLVADKIGDEAERIVKLIREEAPVA